MCKSVKRGYRVQQSPANAELFGDPPKKRDGRSDVAFNLGGTWKLNKHVNLLFAGGRDIVGDTSTMGYIGLQFLTK
jgi:hypothetical protein